MDAEVRKRLKQEVDAINRMRFALDDLAGRVEALEAQLPAPRSFSRRELDRQRRAAVLHARKQGLVSA
jgi:hypothetical protein